MLSLALASQRQVQRHEVHLRVMRLVHGNPEMTTRKIAENVGISNGSAFYVLKSLVEKGFLKLHSFRNSTNKRRYAYILTPQGLHEKSKMTRKFIERKKEEYKDLRAEIDELGREVELEFEDGSLRPWTEKLRDQR